VIGLTLPNAEHLLTQMNMILAGDVGGTKTLLEVGSMQNGQWKPEFSGRYAAITGQHPISAGITPAAIVEAALAFDDPVSLRALDLFIACYGAVVGDCALAVLARGGIYIAGSIAPKIITRLREGGFFTAFNAKGAHSAAVSRMPVSVITNERLGVVGGALIAARWAGN
jgi:glucokinase